MHHPWYTLPTTPEAFHAYLARLSRPSTEGRLVCLRDGGAMAGVIIVDSIIRGRFRHQGCRKEGYSPDMVFIDGAWRDHERWAITVEMTGFPPVPPHPTLPAR